MNRRSVLKASAAAGIMASVQGPLARFAIAQQEQRRVLRFVPHANLAVLDPIWTTAYISRNHGYMIFDTLFGMDAEFRPQPQMAEGLAEEDGGKTVTVTLRRGLKFHDGEPVRAQDCVASLKRWMKRSPIGQELQLVSEDLSAQDDRRLRFRLKRPFPLLAQALGNLGAPIPFIMPERLAQTDPFKQVREMVGSGPYRFKADEFNSGSLIVYERNADYSPTPSTAKGLTAGPKLVHFDRVEWHVITDAATASGALQAGEIDWYEQPPPEIQQMLQRSRDISVEAIDKLPLLGAMRMNFLYPPFNDKKMRQAILPAVDQKDYMVAVAGTDADMYQTGVGVFTPGTPLANNAGMEALTGPRSIDKARKLLKEAGYTDQLIRLLAPTDILAPTAMGQVAADMFRRLEVNLDPVLTDWGTLVQRRASREPLDKGGWSVFCTAFGGYDFLDPSGHFPLRGNGTGAWFGWPSIPRLEELRQEWFVAADPDAQKRIGREIQRVALDEVVYIPLGAYVSITALKRNLKDRTLGFPIFWNIHRA